MNPDDSTASPSPAELEIEARIVAWVLGEASPFEIAALEQRCADDPALAVFKRRIEAVHGLAGEALRPAPQPLRLAPARRAELLAALGAPQEPPAARPSAVPLPGSPTRRRDLRWLAAIAACVTLGGVVLTTILTTQRRHSHESAGITGADGAPMPMVAAFGQKEAAFKQKEERQRVQREEESRAARHEEFVASAGPLIENGIRPEAGRVPTPKVTVSAAPPPLLAKIRTSADEAVADADGVGVLAPFEVTAENDVGYRASESLAGTRLNTELRDIASSITATSSQFLKDVGETSNETLLQYTANTEVAGSKGNFTAPAGPGSANAKQDRRIFGAVTWADKLREENATVHTRGLLETGANVDFLLEGNDADRPVRPDPSVTVLGSAAGKAEEVVALSPFSVSTEPPAGSTEPQLVFGLESSASANAPAKPAAPTAADDRPVVRPPPPPPPEDFAAETPTAREPVSTFSLHVADASFRLAQAELARGGVPDPAQIRPEEFYNAFDYGDPAPLAGEQVSCRIEQAAHPFLQQRNLVRIAMKVPATGRGAGQPLRLTLLLDTSGSMERPDRAACVRRALDVLAALLGPDDQVSVIGFSRQPRLLAEAVPGPQVGETLARLEHLPAEGGTNFEEALRLAGQLARRHQLATAQNRIVLLTDGAANLGNADPEQLARSVDALRQQGIAFDACGVVLDGLDDTMLEALTRKGDGRYTILDSPEAADAGFARQLAGAFRPAAQNVKVQVRFNPARVASYRLIGFEKHRLREEDFRNDQVDAAELAAEEAAVALYQVEPVPQGEGELGDVFVRFRDTATGRMVERSWTMAYDPAARAFDRASPSLQLAGVAAFAAESLRGGPAAASIDLAALAPVTAGLRSRYAQQARVQELATMVDQIRRLARK